MPLRFVVWECIFFPGVVGRDGTAHKKKGLEGKGRRSSCCVSRYVFESVWAIIIGGIRIHQLICQHGASWLQYLTNWFPITSCDEIAKEYREALWGVPGSRMEQPYTREWRVDSLESHLTLKSVSIDQYRWFLCRFFCLQMSLRISKVLGHDTFSRFWTANLYQWPFSANLMAWLNSQSEELPISSNIHLDLGEWQCCQWWALWCTTPHRSESDTFW